MKEVKVDVASTAKDFESVFAIRKKVFVVEQNVDEREEYDEFETSCTHFIATINDLAVGTCRFRNTDKGIKLERFAVLKNARGKGVGEALMQTVLKHIDLNQHIYLNAQIQVVEFYAKYGFEKEGNIFLEANIKHYKMVYKPT